MTRVLSWKEVALISIDWLITQGDPARGGQITPCINRDYVLRVHYPPSTILQLIHATDVYLIPTAPYETCLSHIQSKQHMLPVL